MEKNTFNIALLIIVINFIGIVGYMFWKTFEHIYYYGLA